MTRIIGYVRVSHEKQVDTGISLADQRRKIEAYCIAMDLELVEIIVDAGHSAGSLKRPGIQRALGMLRDGEADGILVTKLDRLTRSVRDIGDLIEKFFNDRTGKSLHCIEFAVDTRTANGRMVLGIIMTIAQWERDSISERSRAALGELKRRGVKVGRARHGEKHVEETDAEGRRVVAPVAEEQAATERIVALSREKLGVRAIAARLEAEGIPSKRGTRWHATQVQRILSREKAAA